ncbi:MAG: hypothetical protein M1834_001944 [Cirrosporium novae-zelandiae]|nr:MAG: hypothetical protein M1834_001944 [Cirrosporium novae-zelandiae]
MAIGNWTKAVAGWLATTGGILPPSLPQRMTNGNSLLGTLQAPKLPHYLDGPMVSGLPWGLATTKNTDPYTQPPITGVIRSYTFNISRGMIAPDGYLKSGMIINDQFPGPTIEANWGDTIQVTVKNNIEGPEEGTTIHWHGILQKTTPWMDGTPGGQQCPIAPGKSFTYQFQADLYGTTWYHSHYSSQYADGIFGPLIIHGPWDNTMGYDIDLGPVMLFDWYHNDYFSIVKQLVQSYPQGQFPTLPKSDNTLINGKMYFNCSAAANGTSCTNDAGLSKFQFTSGKVHRLRLINSGSEAILKFSIDDHILQVIANDFVPINPYNTTVITLAVGQRTDILVYGSGDPSAAYWMRANLSSACSTPAPTNKGALAVVYYEDADTNYKPNTSSYNIDLSNCDNDPLNETVPSYPLTPPEPDTTTTMVMTYEQNSTGSWNWLMDGITFRADYNSPVLLLANQGNYSYPPEWNTINYGTNSSIRFIIQNNSPISHPMHLHGHNVYVLNEGPGTWDGTIINPSNPQRRDVQDVLANGYLVIQMDADNPGLWSLHCHIAGHLSGGMAFNVLERPEDIRKNYQIPYVMAQTCRDWSAYTGNHIPDQIDSGI